MGKLFILIKRKGSKRYIGVIPAKKGATRAKLKKEISKNIKKGFSFKIVNLIQLNKIIKRQRPRVRKTKRRSKGKRKRTSRPKRRRSKIKRKRTSRPKRRRTGLKKRRYKKQKRRSKRKRRKGRKK